MALPKYSILLFPAVSLHVIADNVILRYKNSHQKVSREFVQSQSSNSLHSRFWSYGISTSSSKKRRRIGVGVFSVHLGFGSFPCRGSNQGIAVFSNEAIDSSTFSWVETIEGRYEENRTKNVCQVIIHIDNNAWYYATKS